MTTILVMRAEGRILADSQALWGQGRLSMTRKVLRLPDGSLVAGAGNQEACFACFEYIKLKIAAETEIGAEAHDVPYVPMKGPEDDHGFTVLHLDNERGLWSYGEFFQPAPILDDAYAIGTGDDVVRTALHLGKTPEEAMAIACELDFNTGPPVVQEYVARSEE